MKTLSIVIVGRNDGYGDEGLTPYNSYAADTFCFRMKRTVKYNTQMLLDRGVKLQYVIVDWSPIDGKTLDQDTYIKELIETTGDVIKHVVVHPYVVAQRGWNPKNFYEYYAKNVGIRNADGDYVLITNPDNLFTEELCDSIVSVLRREVKNEYYRPYSRKDVRKDIDNNLEVVGEGLSFPKNGLLIDQIMGSPAAGDFLMASKNIIVEKSQGYDETESTHNNKQQTTLDSCIILNLYQSGVFPICLSGSLLHLDHAKPHPKDYIPIKSYHNIDNWGMLEVEVRSYKKP